jgi:hypothetical protein
MHVMKAGFWNLETKIIVNRAIPQVDEREAI